ncbi:MAG: anti-sigma factor family protein [Planctomycetota bacterium]
MITCRDFVDFLMRYLDRELPAGERANFEQHIADCPPCHVYLAQYEDTVLLEKEICPDPEGELSEEVPEELVAAILAARQRSVRGS